MTNNQENPRRYRVGDLVVDFGTRKVSRDGENLSLTRKSFELLAALVRKSPQVQTHDELLDEAWGRTVVSDDALKQRIKVLRQSLDDSSDMPRYIESVRGVGYRLIVPVQVLEDSDDPATDTATRSRNAVVAIAVVAVLLILAILGLREQSTDSPITADLQVPIRIAVLPFRDLSAAPGSSWFAAGVTEDIITQLSTINDLSVVSGTTTIRYAGSTKSLAEIADELDTPLVLEGSVRRDGDRVRVTGQLIDARSDTHLWAQDYDQDVEDIFKIQRDVAMQIARALRIELSALEASSFAEPPTGSVEAYEYFLRGREAYQRFLRRENEAAIELYQEALRLDPDFTLAKAELANAYALRVSNYQFGRSAAEPAMALVVEALSDDPQLPEAHKALGLVLAAEGRLSEAREAYLRAATLRPGYQAAVHNLAVISRVLGRLDESLEFAQRAVMLDPASRLSTEMYGLALLELGLMNEAGRWFNAAERRDPLGNRVQLYRMTIGLLANDVEAGRQATERLMTADPGCALCLSRAAIVESMAGNDRKAFSIFEDLLEMDSIWDSYSLLQMGRIRLEAARVHEDAAMQAEAYGYLERAEQIARRVIENGHENPVFPWYLAAIYSVRGDLDESLRWLERSVAAGRYDHAWDRMEPALLNVRSHPRFSELNEQMRQRVAAMRERAIGEGWHTAEPPVFP